MKHVSLLLISVLLLCLLLGACTDRKPDNDLTSSEKYVPSGSSEIAANKETQESSESKYDTTDILMTEQYTEPWSEEENATENPEPVETTEEYLDPDEGEGGMEVVSEVVVEVTGNVSFGGN